MTDKTFCFVSNYLTPHQLPLCLAMVKETKNKFVFIETESLPKERKRLGYPTLGSQYDFVLNVTESQENLEKALKIAKESSVTIIGSAPDVFIRERLRENKLTFRFSERIFKKRYFDPLRRVKYTLKNFKYRKKNLFFLLSSAYASHDYKRCGIRKEKMLKWGYFPEVGQKPFCEIKKEKNKCVWVGRFLSWKHPTDAIEAVIKLREESFAVEMVMVGVGETLESAKALVKRKGAEEYIHFVGSQPYEKVREFMQKAEIFLFTSDYNEGWGAVLNEAMDSGCAVVASHACGSVPFLIKNNENGLIYRYGDNDQLYEQIKKILIEGHGEVLGEAARETVSKEWNADVAVKKLISFCEAFFQGDYAQGVCQEGILSYAEAISQQEMYEKGIK